MDLRRAQIVGAERAAYVSPNFPHNEHQRTFNTIQSAIDYIHNSDWYSTLNNENLAIVEINPGVYREKITCWQYIILVANNNFESTKNKTPVTIAYVFGNESDYLITPGKDYYYYCVGIQFYCYSGGGGNYSKMINGAFIDCIFWYGSFLEDTTETDPRSPHFINCIFKKTAAFNLTGVRAHGDRSIRCERCGFYDVGFKILSTYVGTPNYIRVIFDNCNHNSTASEIGADWNVTIEFETMRNYNLTQERFIFDTSGDVEITDSLLACGIHFKSEPSVTKIQKCDFNEVKSTLISGADITTDVDITCDKYIGNVQQNGIDGGILIPDKVKNVGGDQLDKYKNLEEAIKSVRYDELIKINENLTDLSTITMPASGVVTIDGQHTFNLNFTGNIVELGLDNKLTLNGVENIMGGNVEINGNNAEFHLNNCPYSENVFQILATSGTGSKVHIINSNLTGDTGHSAIQVNNINTEYIINDSKLKGAIGQPAIEFTVDADGKLNTKFSTFVHGDVGINAPIVYTGIGKVDLSVYNCGLNAGWDPASIYNTIGTANNTTDEGIDY